MHSNQTTAHDIPLSIVDSLPMEDEPLPELSPEQIEDLQAQIHKDHTASDRAEPTAEVRQELIEAFSRLQKTESLYKTLKRLDKEYPMVMGRRVHLKKRTSKTRNKKNR